MGKAQAAESTMFLGIETEKFDAESIANALEKVGIKPSSKASLMVRAEALKKHFDEEKAKGAKLLDCDTCMSSSTADFDACPFCGVGEEEPAAAAAEPGDESEPEMDGAGDEPGDDVPPPDYVAEDDVPPPDYVAATVTADVVPAPDPDAKPEVPPSPVAGQKLEPLKKPRKGAKGKEPAAALAVVPPPAQVLDGMIDPSLSPLDKFVAEIKYLRRATEVGGYMLAKRLAEGEMAGVWKTRLDSKQKPVYRNFGTFAEIELGMSEHYVRDQLKLYNQFTEEQFKAIGPTKLRLVIQVAPDARPNLLEKIKGGASTRQIKRELGHKSKDVVGAKGTPIPTPKPELSKSGKVTLAIVAGGKHKFKFFAKPEKKGDEPKPAKRIGQQPWAKLPITVNDTDLLLTITLDRQGCFEGVLEARRVDPTK